MVALVYYPTDLSVFDIPLLHYYINIRSSITCCLFSGDIYLPLGISLSGLIFFVPFATFLELFFGGILETSLSCTE